MPPLVPAKGSLDSPSADLRGINQIRCSSFHQKQSAGEVGEAGSIRLVSSVMAFPERFISRRWITEEKMRNLPADGSGLVLLILPAVLAAQVKGQEVRRSFLSL